jgi:hypothetical protein
MSKQAHHSIFGYTALRSATQLLVLLISCLFSVAQSARILTPDAFIGQVKQFHPVVRQAGLGVEMAASALQAARGEFDPAFEMNYQDKTFNGVNYYRYANPEIKIPTATGVTVKGGFENTAGSFTNPELTNGAAGYLGLEVPLLKGLLIDKQRAALRQAKIFSNLSRQEQACMVNDLLLESYDAYWEWAGAHQLMNIYGRYLDVAEKRMELVKIAFNNGDRSVADTIEAFTQLQFIRMLQADASILYNNKYYGLSMFLWDSTQKPYLLSDVYIPDTLSFINLPELPALNLLEQFLSENHPALKIYKSKLQMLEVECKLKFQNLLPSVVVGANILSKEYFNSMSLGSQYLENNYKLGLTIKSPLFFRQGRGEYRMTKLKIMDNNLQFSLKSWDLQNKLRQYHRETDLYRNQINTAMEMRDNNAFLLKTEELRLSQGESSLFLINSRQNKLLETDQKIIELRVKYFKSYYSTYWSAGQLR